MSDTPIETTEEMPEPSKLDKMKDSIKKNWKPLIIGTVIGGGVILITFRGRIFRPQVAETAINMMPKAYFSEQHVSLIMEASRQGPPSYVVFDPATGEIWMSQELFRKAIGATKEAVSRYFNDPDITSIMGRSPERIGIAVA